MPVAKPLPALPDLALGTRFPARLLNVLPAAWKRRHLMRAGLRASGGESASEGFGFAEWFGRSRRVLLAWPDDPIEILAGFPAARALVEALPSGAECLHLCEAAHSPLVQGLFPNAVLEWRAPELAWHDASMQSLARDLRGFAPDITVTFSRSPYPTVLQAAMLASRARARVGWEGAVHADFANVRLGADSATPLAAGFFRALDLWRYAGLTPREQWTHLQPDTGRHDAALREWEAKRAAPASTWLYVRDAAGLDALDEDLHEQLRLRLETRDAERFTLGAVVWNPDMKPISRQGPWLDAPVFHESDFSALLAAIDGSRGVIGPHGFALHFASLVETRCVALLDPSESRYDATGLNPLFEVEWM